MIYRRHSGDADDCLRRDRRALLAFAAGALATKLLPSTGAEARAPTGPMDHLATVVNGGVVGSAFLLGPEIAVTNAHVVAGLRGGSAVRVVGASDRGALRARVLGISGRMDLAVLLVPAGLRPPVPTRDAPRRSGLAVRTAGVDARYGLGPRMELAGALAAVQVSLPSFGQGAIARLPGVRLGFSGAPVLDGNGSLVGMIAAIRAGTTNRGGTAGAGAFAPQRTTQASEAFVLHAADVRREANRLLSGAQS